MKKTIFAIIAVTVLVIACIACAGCTSTQQTSDTSSTTTSATNNQGVFEIKILDTIVGEKAISLMKNESDINELPTGSNTAYLIKYRATCKSLPDNIKSDGLAYNPSLCAKLYINGSEYSQKLGNIMPDSYPRISGKVMHEGDSTEGWAYFIAPKSNNGYIKIDRKDMKSNTAYLS